jgi:hypothetical protein
MLEKRIRALLFCQLCCSLDETPDLTDARIPEDLKNLQMKAVCVSAHNAAAETQRCREIRKGELRWNRSKKG